MSDRLSLRFRDAQLGAISSLLIAFGVMLFPLATALGEIEASLRHVVSIVLFLFPPAILGAVYSLFFEKSKFYGGLSILLTTIALLVKPLAWHWLHPYLPIGCVFIIFCAIVWVLNSRSNS
jgi:VIT1/CCC1 family predicted Fe2+/Mn2+ transporter